MKHLSAFCACLILLLIAQLDARSSVWEVTKDGKALFIGGTCHLLRASDFPLPTEFDTAYAASDIVVFEADPTQMQDPAVGARLMAKSRYTDGRSLKTVLSQEVYAALEAQCRQSGIPVASIQQFKPGMAMTMLSVMELAKLGVSQAGVDMHYAERAQTDGKDTRALETVEFQIDLIATMGEGNENEFVRYGIQDLKQIKTRFESLIGAWEAGDIETIQRLFVEDIKAFPDIYEAVLADRNANWVPQIKGLLNTPATEFVLVGVGHIPGEDGLLTLLEDEGYAVNPVNP